MALELYRKKRNFQKTSEPKGVTAKKRKSGLRFVVQKHAASHLHYDFRLEMGGTLKSWAVPKGIPVAKGEKRLAVEVEDHPVSYIDFEGTIPKGQYGGGTVMVWDKGTYEAQSENAEKELVSGKLHFTLHGIKLKGDWYLVRLRNGKEWLLIRSKNDLKPISKKQDDTSALSKKSMVELAKGKRVWQSSPAKGGSRSNPKKTPGHPPSLKFIEPMKAKLVLKPPAGEWLYEIKFDGFRALAFKHGKEARLLSRNEKDFAEKFPEVWQGVKDLKVEDAIIDGEIVALDEKGRSSFQLLQAYELNQERPPIFFYAFDLLRLNNEDVRSLPVGERKKRLEKILEQAPEIIRYSASLPGTPSSLLKQAARLGLEGLIGKRADSPYESGRRSGAWIKLKLHREQEMVIGGYTNPTGTRPHFGALLTGFYEKGKLQFAGKVGTGFNVKLLGTLYAQFKKIARDTCPFANLPEKRGKRYGQAITAAEMKRCHWVDPQMVAQIKFSEWTRDEKMRQPVFLGLREDKDAIEVVREKTN
ncbi:MAG: non-homologous end-joining DNA ligase [Verrucomicrobiota bacterium]